MGHTSTLDAFLNVHKDQLISSGVPQLYWDALYRKLLNQTFDAGNVFQIVKIDYNEDREDHQFIWALQALIDLSKNDSKHVYLIDHAWTYCVQDARQQLLTYDTLRLRLAKMFDLDMKLENEVLVEKILKYLWKVNNTYSIGNAENVEDRLPLWYIMDEVGTSVTHSDSPNCKIVPFIHVEEQITYSILFPIENIDAEDLLYRDFAEGITDPIKRSAALLPWLPKSFEDVPIDPPILGEDYYLRGHIKETLPILNNSTISKCTSLKVFTQYDLVRKFLTESRFQIVDDEDEADVLWYVDHFRDFEKLSQSPQMFINQFPYEYVLTVKDLLCMTCRRKGPAKWLPITYNLVVEIPNFVSYFQQRQKKNLNNYWIVKPYNLARGLDMHITDNLDYILRVSATGPKIVQKYITNPVVFYRPECGGKVKFDIRYVILLKNVKPLEAYVYKNFFLRFANKPFALNEFDLFEKHFTVMNYTENAVLKHLKCEDFKEQWQQQYSNYSWNNIENSILAMLRNILECATLEKPPCGIAESPQSRAVYAADIMLEWDKDGGIQPKILEINFTPDCKRACDYYPEFYNDIFKLLFLNEASGMISPL